MIRLILFLLAAPLWADNALWIDLSGDWRRISGPGRPEFAQPGFDDSSWAVITLPTPQARLPYGRGWMRKRIRLPEGSDRSELALTLGTIHSRYELYVNGQLVGNTDTKVGHRIKRPLTFRLPLIEGPELLIAVRFLTTAGSNPALRGIDRGPWVLSYNRNAPFGAGEQALIRLAHENTPSLLLAILYLLICLTSFGSWVADRARKELLWFALLTLLRSVSSAILFAGPSADWPVVSNRATGSEMFGGILTVVLYAWMILALTGWRGRWIHALLALWMIVTPFVTFGGFGNRYMLLKVTELFWGCLLLIRVAWSNRSFADREVFLRPLLILPCLYWIANAGSFFVFDNAASTYLVTFWGFRWLARDLAYLAVSCLILFLLFRRVQADRREKVRLGGELEAARAVQGWLLTGSQPGVDAVCLPATEVGGDFWHVFDNRLIVVGDVSGKGLKAAMIVSLITGALRNRRSDSPAALLAELNAVVQGSGGFVTCCVILLEPDGRLTAANAGHPSPYLDGRELELTPGLPLGIVPEAEYAEMTLPFHGGLTLVSDGVIEAANASGELFGFDRTRAISTQSAQEIADAARQWGQNDDITVVTVRRSE